MGVKAKRVASEAKLNLNCKIDGDIDGACYEQSVAAGSTVYAGDIIYVKLSRTASSEPAQPTQPPQNNTTSNEDGRVDALPPNNDDDDD